MPVVLKCPKCRGKFKYDVTEGWPDFCVLCNENINNRRADDDVVMPAFLSIKSKNNDAVARQIMDGSETRMHLAAAAAGVPSSEMASLKITDINDRRDSEVSHVKEVNAVSQHMDAMAARGMPVGFGAPVDVAAAATGAVNVNGRVVHGIAPRAGISAMSNLQSSLPRSVPNAPMTKHG